MISDRHRLLAYQLLAILLYGDHDWIDREGNMVVIGTTAASRVFGTRVANIRGMADWLYHGGLLDEVNWHARHAVIRVRLPLGAVWGSNCE